MRRSALRLGSLHPLATLTSALVWIATSLAILDATFQIAVIATVVLAFLFVERRSPLYVLALCIPFALFGLGLLSTHALFPRPPASAIPTGIAPGAETGWVLVLRTLACGLVSALFVTATAPDRLVKALIGSWKLPARVGYALFAALQIAPDLVAEAQRMRLARAVRFGRPPRRIPGPRELASLVVPLLAVAIRRASRTAVVLEARGLSTSRPRTLYRAPRLRAADIAFIVLSFALLIAIAWATVMT